MGVNKVMFGTRTLIDLTGDTVRADKLQAGYTAHGADGEVITGTMSASSGSSSTPSLEPYVIDRECGHIVENGVWESYDGYAHVYVFEVTSKEYMIILGCPTETFHAMFTTTDVTQTDDEVTGVAITDQNNPAYFTTVKYRPGEAGYLVIEVGRYGENWCTGDVYDAMECWGYKA